MRKVSLIIAVVFLLSSPVHGFAALYINEFSSHSNPDWVEIYNSDSSSEDLSKYILRDSSDSDSNKVELSGIIQGNSFAVFDWSNKLNNSSSDSIRLLLKSDESVVDQIAYGSGSLIIPGENQTAGRSKDGESNWVILSTATKGFSNNSSQVFSTPTSAPTNTPTPTHTPTPTKTPTPAPQPTNTPVPTATPAKSPTPTIKKSPTPSLSAQALAAQASPKPTTKSTVGIKDGSENSSIGKVMGSSNMAVNDQMPGVPESTVSYNWGKLFLIIGGVVAICGIGYLVYSNYRVEKADEL